MSSDSEVTPGQSNLDLIDEEWVCDSLSDDEVEIAPENDVAADDGDVLVNATAPLARKEEEEKWNDLGLDSFQSGN